MLLVLLEGIGWQVAQSEMQPHAVVEAHDAVGDVHHGHGLGVIGVVALPDPLRLEAQQEVLHHRVDVPVSSRRFRVFQIRQDEQVQLSDDAARFSQR